MGGFFFCYVVNAKYLLLNTLFLWYIKSGVFMTKESAEFVIYIINFLAHSLKKYPSEIYKVLESTNCINEYLVPFYDVLHTMGTEMIAEDVKKFVKNRGSSL